MCGFYPSKSLALANYARGGRGDAYDRYDLAFHK